MVRLQRFLVDLGIYKATGAPGQLDNDTQKAVALLAQLARLPRADNTLEALTQINAVHDRIQRRRPVGPRHLIPSTAPDIVLLMLDGNDLAAFAGFIISLLDDRTLIASATRTTSSGLEFSARAFMTRKPLASARPVTCRYYEATIRSGTFVVEVPRAQACRHAFGPWQLTSAPSENFPGSFSSTIRTDRDGSLQIIVAWVDRFATHLF